MPLKQGKSQKVVGGNIGEMVRAYKKTGKIGASRPKSKEKAIKQATAIALSEAGKSRKPVKAKDGGAFMVVKKRDGNKPVKIY
jgi:hypothetical protein